jgi:aminoglycoside phosphotransferase (APT) family kinase protein
MQITEILQMVQWAREQRTEPAGRDGWLVRRVRHGMNNALYQVQRGDQAYAVKLCVDDERRRAQREYGALRLLEGTGVEVSPQPLGLDESTTVVPYPAVVYRWLPGQPLSQPAPTQERPGDRALSQAQAAALLESLQRLHGLPYREQSGLSEAWFHWFELKPYLAELEGFLAQYRPWLCEDPDTGKLICARLERIVGACTQVVTRSPAAIDRANLPLRLCHVDPNPANAIWGEDGRVRWVDWEYSGWGDPALELAEFRWHPELACLSASQTAWMRKQYQPPPGDGGFEERLGLWDALLVARWPFLLLRWLWSVHNGPDRVRLSVQEVRAAELRRRLMALIERAEAFFEL